MKRIVDLMGKPFLAAAAVELLLLVLAVSHCRKFLFKILHCRFHGVPCFLCQRCLPA